MQWIAMLTMLIDHIGATWFEDHLIFRVIGRMAFPIYAYYVVQGMHFTSDRRRYVIRLGLLALLSQAPFSWLFHTWALNVIATFFICVLSMYGFEDKRLSRRARWMCLIAGAVLLLIIPCDYGIYALILMLLYRYGKGLTVLLGHLGLNILFVAARLTSAIQYWSILPSVVFSVAREDTAGMIGRRSVPKIIWRAFYPGHLLILACINEVAAF